MTKFKTILIGTALTFSISSWADLRDKLERNWDESTGISKLYYGHTNEANNLGLSHERRQGALGIELMALASSDNGTEDNELAKKQRQTLLGASLMHHLHDDSMADVFLGTGFAVIRHEDVSVETDKEEDVTSFGPMFKIGSNYYLNSDWSIGLEYVAAMNWSSDEVAAEQSFGFLTLGFTY